MMLTPFVFLISYSSKLDLFKVVINNNIDLTSMVRYAINIFIVSSLFTHLQTQSVDGGSVLSW